MGSVSSCYPSREPTYDTKQFLAELITVQTAILLTDSASDNSVNSEMPNRRQSLEYTITTSLTMPHPAGRCDQNNHKVTPRRKFPPNCTDTLIDVINAHFTQRVDVKSDGLLPNIQEISEVCIST